MTKGITILKDVDDKTLLVLFSQVAGVRIESNDGFVWSDFLPQIQTGPLKCK